MRKIKFRGKDIKTGEWAYGGIYQPFPGVCYIMQRGQRGGTKQVEVAPETVGECTSLKANGVEIYEGDIIQGTWQVDHKSVRKGVVNYWEKFGLYGLNKDGALISVIWTGCEIIGNTTDNPELLEE